MPDGVRMQHKEASSMIVSARKERVEAGEAPRGAPCEQVRCGGPLRPADRSVAFAVSRVRGSWRKRSDGERNQNGLTKNRISEISNT
jgi:hypothetical protein